MIDRKVSAEKTTVIRVATLARIFAEGITIGRTIATRKPSESLKATLSLAGRRILKNLRKFRIPI